MELSEELMERFLSGECKKDEIAFVQEKLQGHPELLDEYIQQRPPFLENRYNHKLPENISDRLFNQIYSEIENKKKRRFKTFVQLGSVAALIALVFGLWHMGLWGHTRMQNATMISEAKIVKRNTSDTLQTWLLPDKSIVKARPGAILTYSSNYNKYKRDVFLTGNAEFDIRHNAQKPFNVFSNKISTTVLGTVFSINADRKQIEVKLLEGKVMVKKIADKTNKPLYLNPGNAVVYTISTGKFLAISNFKKGEQKHTLQTRHKQALTSNSHSDEVITFNNTSMEYAIDKLAEQYEVEIQYSPLDIEGVNLIAKISKQRPLKKVLKHIAITNGLTVRENGKNVFILEKAPSRP